MTSIARLNIDSVVDVSFEEDNFEKLVLPPGYAKMVKAMVETHFDEKSSHSKKGTKHHADLVRGKGKGLIILLHGPPGVGKTSTAECVADHTRRPLFPITCGDIGETAEQVEKNLTACFRMADRWGCVLLLDEADVFLAERSKVDLRRNALVSGRMHLSLFADSWLSVYHSFPEGTGILPWYPFLDN